MAPALVLVVRLPAARCRTPCRGPEAAIRLKPTFGLPDCGKDFMPELHKATTKTLSFLGLIYTAVEDF